MVRLTSIVSLLLTLLVFPFTAQAQRSDWILLGQQTVGFQVDRDTINITQNEEWFRSRSFRQLHFMAERNDVFLMSVRLVYINGYTEDIRVDQLIRQGTQLPIDLRGERSYLRRIEMLYRARPDFRGQAVVRVYGELAGRGPGPGPGPGRDGRWVELGCQDVNLVGADRDSIRVGRRDGRFRAIRLYVRGADVEMLDLKVIYADGTPDDIRVQSVIRAGDRTRPLDLQGRERAIQRIDMVYRMRINPTQIIGPQGLRTATVCVEALD